MWKNWFRKPDTAVCAPKSELTKTELLAHWSELRRVDPDRFYGIVDFVVVAGAEDQGEANYQRLVHFLREKYGWERPSDFYDDIALEMWNLLPDLRDSRLRGKGPG